jgi:GAF domain-containing protein
MFPMVPTRGSIACRAILDKQVVHVPDLQADPDVLPTIKSLGWTAQLSVPLMREGSVLGAISLVNRTGPFAESQIALLGTFAEQAVIAITSAETYRALQTRTADLQQSLEYQTATSDVLKVISRSTFELQPVLETLLKTAARLCQADMGHIRRREGNVYPIAAVLAAEPAYDHFLREQVAIMTPGRESVIGRAVLERRVVHVTDIATDPEYGYPEAVTLGKVRTSLGVPLLREGVPVGAMTVARTRVEPFTERQIELVRTFADQAVIAIENTRLITEQREALEQQTATAEVLGVINSNPGDLAPVFDAILEMAHSLCGTPLGSLVLRDGDQLRAVATRGYPQKHETFARQGFPPTQAFKLFLSGERFVQVLDASEPPTAFGGDPLRDTLVEAGVRTALFVPLRKDETVLGYISAQRQEVRPFTEKQIALLQNFAAQAVIAMENARLLNEQREALDRQTATAEVLGVINASPGNLAPVFDAMLQKALHLCESAFGILATYDGELLHHVAWRGVTLELAEFLHKPLRSRPGMVLHRVIQGEDIVQITNMVDDDAYRSGIPGRRALVDLGGARTALLVALRKDKDLLGVLLVFRQEVRPFSDKQIALLQNFAAQAVIAMENARLLAETQEALEQQTATAEVLQVINSSPGNLAPVFDALLEKAMRLCGAAFGELQTYDGEVFRLTAMRGIPAAYAEFRMNRTHVYGAGTIPEKFIVGEGIQHIMDAKDSEAYRDGEPNRRALVDLGGARTILSVPLRKDDALLGFISAYRQEIRPYSESQVALLRNFAAQAVIAMENARLLTETREALEQQTATANILRIISSSPTDVQPTFDAIAESAATLCSAASGGVFRFDGSLIHLVAQHGWGHDELVPPIAEA